MVDMAAINAKLAVLKKTYAAQLPAKLAEIDTAWQALCGGAWNNEQLHELHRLVHSLTGSGKTFGFPALSDTARQLEVVLKDLWQNNIEPDQAKRAQINELWQKVQQAAQAE